ncbi:hypothetical protein ACFS07_08090 [Undibacterium arcticum]
MDSQSDQKKQQQRQQLRQAALEYHECPTPGKISVTPHQATDQSTRPGLGVFAGRRGAMRRDRRRSCRCL